MTVRCIIIEAVLQFFYLFAEFRMQQYKQQNSRVHNTVYAYMDTKRTNVSSLT